MFNFKKIASLQDKNAQLQEQLTLVTGLLHQRQDDVMRLQRELATRCAAPVDTSDNSEFKDAVQELKERLDNKVDSLKELLADFDELVSDSDSDSDDEEDDED